MLSYSLCIVDDDETITEGIAFALKNQYQLKTFTCAEEAMTFIKAAAPDLVLLDIGLPGMDGIEALRVIKCLAPETLVIMITAFEEVDSVVAAMKSGAYDYIVKPLRLEALELTIKNACNSIRLRKEVQSLQEQFLSERAPCVIGDSKEIHSLLDFVRRVAKSPDTPILILGETGTGKELIAQTIHFRSPNFSGPLITVNCASIPKDLIESELFGYVKGAFTGASAAGKRGLISEAAGGTLFLDEVGDLSQEAQAKLLRFLEGGEFYPVGDTRVRKVKTRVISATNKDLRGMIQEGIFREDLYFRLSAITVEIPSLRERQDDILPLAHFFLVDYSKKFNRNFTRIQADAEQALLKYPWQGNIRELKNMIERAILVGNGPDELTVDDLGLQQVRPAETNTASTILPELAGEIDLTALLEDVERSYLRQALASADGNESKAARLLSMNHHTFRYRKRKLLAK